MITENLSTLKIHKLSQAQYDRELEAGNIDASALYLTPGEEMPKGGGEWKHIRTVTIPEDITTDTSGVNFAERANGGVWFGFDIDESGNPFSYTELLVVSYAGITASSSGTFVVAIDNSTPGYSAFNNSEISTNLGIGKAGSFAYSWSHSIITGGDSSISYGVTFGGGNSNLMSDAKQKKHPNYPKIEAIRVYAPNLQNDGYVAGSEFRFYGR